MRIFIAISGFFVFIVSANLYGPEGRGLIAYGTSLVSMFSLFFSFNLGRAFLFEKTKNKKGIDEKLKEYISLNLLLIILTILSVLTFGLLSSIKDILSANYLILFLIIVPYYLWSVNGTVIFATLNLSYKQELIILSTRIVLVLFLLYELLAPSKIEFFTLIYGLILGSGALCEMLFLANPFKKITVFLNPVAIVGHVKNSFWSHIDYISFHTFPLILILISGRYLGLKEVGRLNFAIQLVNFIFLFSFVASIRVKSFVAGKGSFFHNEIIKKLFLGTMLLSVGCVALVFIGLRSELYYKNFQLFGDVHTLFIIFSLAIPGYMIYQFLYPISIENDVIKQSALLNALSLFCFLIFALITVPIWQSLSVCLIFSAFYLSSMVIQLFLNKRIFT